MATPPQPPCASFADALLKSGILTTNQQDTFRRELVAQFAQPQALGRRLMDLGWLTPYQVNQFLQGRGRNLVVGPYLLLDRLGQGGTGVVFKARHLRMNRTVAVKLVKPELLADKETMGRFYREIQAVGQLSHPHIVHSFDAGPVDQAHVLVMEYIDGPDLDRFVKQQGPLPVAQACDYIRQAALALQHAHERGMIHRDVKPANLLLVPAREGAAAADWGLIKLVDLGLARLQTSVDGGLTAHSPGMMGTPDYLAPEQALDFHEVDARTDVYSLGCTLYYLLSGQPPFPGGTLTQKLMRHQQVEPPPITAIRTDLPDGLPGLLRHLMAKRPEDRCATAALVAQALSTGNSTIVTRVTLGTPAEGTVAVADPSASQTVLLRPARWPRITRRRALIAGSAGLLLTGSLLLARPWQRGQGKDAAPGETTVRVVANEPWQDTYIDLQEGVEVTVTANGRWRKRSAVADCSAEVDEQLTHDWNLLPDANAMTLVGREGPTGPLLLLGPSRTFVPRDSGRLFLQANDVELTGNTGALTVSVRGGVSSSVPVAMPQMPQGEIVLPGNVALASRGAQVTGPQGSAGDLIDGVTTGYTGYKGFASAAWPCEWVVTLPRVYLLKEIRVLLWDGNQRSYQYAVDTSADGKKYTSLVDRSKGQWRSWQTLEFPARAVKYIKLRGLHNTDNSGFHVVELEAYCIPPTKPAQPKWPSVP